MPGYLMNRFQSSKEVFYTTRPSKIDKNLNFKKSINFTKIFLRVTQMIQKRYAIVTLNAHRSNEDIYDLEIYFPGEIKTFFSRVDFRIWQQDFEAVKQLIIEKLVKPKDTEPQTPIHIPKTKPIENIEKNKNSKIPKKLNLEESFFITESSDITENELKWISFD